MREKLKNLLILLLGLLMIAQLMVNLALGLGEDTLQTLRMRLGMDTRPDSTQTAFAESALHPGKLAVRGPDGLYLACGSEVDGLLGTVSPILSEALGSVGKITSIENRDFLQMLSDPHIAFSFSYPVPFYLLQHWWTGETGFSSDQSATTLVILSVEEKVVLAFCDDSSGKYYLAETAAGYDRFVSLCQAAPNSNAFYAFERDGYHMLRAHEPVWSTPVYYPTYTVTLPDFSEEGVISEDLLSAFDINHFLAEVYKESDGDIVYIEGYNALQFSKDGHVVYSVTGDGGIELELSDGMAEKERRAYVSRQICEILERIAAAAGCDGGFSIAGISAENNGYVITCERSLGGGFITEKDGYSAVVTIEEEKITGIRMTLSTTSESGTAMLLPLQLATALLEGKDNSFCVRYIEQDGQMIPKLYSMGGMYHGME